MLQGLRRKFSRRTATGKALTVESSHRSTTSSEGAGTALFALEEAAEGAAVTRRVDATIHARGAAVVLTAGDDEGSGHGRRAAAALRRFTASAAAPDSRATTAYQVSVLLSLSTYFEHKLQSDASSAMAALAGARSSTRPTSCGSGAGGSGPLPLADPAGGAASMSAASRGADVARVALALSRRGYTVIVRRVLHSKTYWTKSFDNAFIVALDTSSEMGVEYIVDPHFRDLFRTAAMSPQYSAVWEALPPVFVGMPCQMQPVVQLLCEEVETSFLEAGRPCPPWRGWAATINRWMSDQFVDIQVPPQGAPEAEVASFVARCSSPAGGAAPAPESSPASSAVPASGAGLSAAYGRRPGSASGVEGAAALRSSGGGGGRPMNGLAASRPSDGVASSFSSSCGVAARRQVQQPLRAQVGFATLPPPGQAPLQFGAKAPPQLGAGAAGLPAARAAAAQGGAQTPAKTQQDFLSTGAAAAAAAAALRRFAGGAPSQSCEPAAAHEQSRCASGADAAVGGSSDDDDASIVYASGSAGGASSRLRLDGASPGPGSLGAASGVSTLFDEDDEEEEGAGPGRPGASASWAEGRGAAAWGSSGCGPAAGATAAPRSRAPGQSAPPRQGLLATHLQQAQANRALLFGLHAPANRPM